jgi:phage terminase large subunit GpA-like protein
MIGERPMTAAERQRRHRLLHPKPRRTQQPVPMPVASLLAPRRAPDGNRLRNLEYDVLLRRTFYTERAPLAEWLHQTADAVIEGLRSFAEQYGPAVAEGLQKPRVTVAALLGSHIAAQIVELGDLHLEIDKALNSAAARWKRFPPERGENGPEAPQWVPPADYAEAQRRQLAATAALEEIKLQVRSGALLADWPACKATADLLIAWRLTCLEWFAVRACASILAQLALPASNENQWGFFAAVQRAMRAMLNSIVRKFSGSLVEAFGEFLAPPDELPVSRWADAYRVLNSRAAAEPGPYRTSRTPYLRDLMDDLSPFSPVQRVVFQKAAQVGASESGNCWLGAIVDQAPGPVMIVQPTVELAKRYSNQRLAPLFDESDRLRSKIRPARTRDSGNTMLLKEFLGGVLIITGANSAAGLRSMPVRYLFVDEVDAYPGDIEDEGDPVALARARLRTFSFRAKELIASTPKLKGMSRISREYEASDRRKYFVPCPLCRAMQVLEFSKLRWQPGKPETVLYQCSSCAESFAEHHKEQMLAAGEWRATATALDPATHGYHISGLYSPSGWLSWMDIVRDWELAADDVDARKTFVNTVLGEAWEEEADAVPDWQRLYERREAWPYGTVPERGLFLTAGADVQIDRIEVDIWAWGRNLESWLIEHLILNGDPGRPEVWASLTELLSRTWEHATGARLALQRLAIDTGFATQSVYQWARNQDRATVLPVRGIGAYDRLVPVSGPTKIEIMENGKRYRRGLNLWTISVSFFKKEFYKHLSLAKPTTEQLTAGFTFPAGFVHLPDIVSDEWIKQLVAEQQVIVRARRGFATRTEWRQLRPRNEALDCRNYARAAVWLAGADRWSDARWHGPSSSSGSKRRRSIRCRESGRSSPNSRSWAPRIRRCRRRRSAAISGGDCMPRVGGSGGEKKRYCS